MNIFEQGVKKIIEKNDLSGLKQLLSKNPNLANEGITIPFDIICRTKAHPLHRVCDAVFAKKITDSDAVKIAKIFLDFGARIDGDKNKNEGTPLLAASSLHAEQVGIFYIDNGADIHHTHNNDGVTALHWAAYCGLDKLVDRLIKANAEIDIREIAHNSTPLGWAIHCLKSMDKMNEHNQINCIKLLLQNGADITILDKEKRAYLIGLSKENIQIKNLIS